MVRKKKQKLISRHSEYFGSFCRFDLPTKWWEYPAGIRTQQSETMFTTLLELQPQDAGDSGDNDGEIAQTPAAVAEQTLNDIIDRFADKKFDMDDVSGSIDDLGP